MMKYAIQLETFDPRYKSFAQKLNQLAAGFQTEALLEIVQKVYRRAVRLNI